MTHAQELRQQKDELVTQHQEHTDTLQLELQQQQCEAYGLEQSLISILLDKEQQISILQKKILHVQYEMETNIKTLQHQVYLIWMMLNMNV